MTPSGFWQAAPLSCRIKDRLTFPEVTAVSHISVYRRWRPQTFEEVIGQQRITRTLQKALRAGRITNPPRLGGRNTREPRRNLTETAAPSHTQVDHIRDLKGKIVLVPAEGRYKVYIIDEVHMLSTSAFNALLKTLEEPPPHAVFVLVTTEPHKIPATVASPGS